MAERPILYPNPLISMPSAPSRKAGDYLEAYKGWAYNGISHIVRQESTIPIKLFKVTKVRNSDDEIEEVTEHPALAVLHNVNSFMNEFTLRELTGTYMKLLGEAVWVLLRDSRGEVVEIWPLRPDWVKVIPSAKDFVGGYKYAPGGGIEEVVLKTEDVIFFKDFSPTNPYRGYGNVKAGAMALDIEEFSSTWNRNFFFNNAMPSIIFKTEAKLKPEEQVRYMSALRSEFGGLNNAHKVGLMAGAKWEVEKLGTDPRELDYLESKKYVRDEILATLGVSKANIGVVEDVNRANQEASDVRLMKHVIKPNLIRFVGYLNEFFLPNWNDEGLFFNFEDPVPDDVDMKLKVYENGIRNGWLTPNEIRAEEGRDDHPDGDVLYTPQGVQAAGMSNITEAVRSLFKSDRKAMKKKKYKLAAPIPSISLKELRVKRFKEEIKGDLVEVIGKLMSEPELITEKEEEKFYDKAGKDYVWKELVAETDIKELRMQQIIGELADEQASKVLDKLDKNARLFSKMAGVKHKLSATSFVFNTKAEVKRWATVLTPFIYRLIQERGEKVLGGFGQPNKFDANNEAVSRWVESIGEEFLSEVNAVTRASLIDTIKEGLRTNESPDQIRARIIEIYQLLKGSRAELIARSETLRAANFATLEAYKQSGVVVAKEWLTASDERTCPWCNSMNGKILDISNNYFSKGDTLNIDGQKLSLGYSSVAAPPLHPRCRCTILPITIAQFRAMESEQTKLAESNEEHILEVVQNKVHELTLQKKEERVEELNDQIEKLKGEVDARSTELKELGPKQYRKVMSEQMAKAHSDLEKSLEGDKLLARMELNDIKLRKIEAEKELKAQETKAEEIIRDAEMTAKSIVDSAQTTAKSMYESAEVRAKELISEGKERASAIVRKLKSLRDGFTK